MDDYPLLNLFWTMMWFFVWVVWLFLLFRIVMDIFSSDDLSGWGKAGWTALVVLLPYIGVLVYLIARGRSMNERQLKRAADQEQAFKSYIRQNAGPAEGVDVPAQLEKLASLKQRGTLSDTEYEQAKAKILA
ncbi:SHOCT domain-containing protein [Nonomuraea sp. NPDC050663]|uniref:SHOCT domain-containing protein n=1 Tax=Nonomuraea sp. NPDC050663 TaxID=3364370 RepID=UPI00378D33C4